MSMDARRQRKRSDKIMSKYEDFISAKEKHLAAKNAYDECECSDEIIEDILSEMLTYEEKS